MDSIIPNNPCNHRSKIKPPPLWMAALVVGMLLIQAVSAACTVPGYYTDSTAAADAGNAACLVCPAGSACPDASATTPAACAAGTWSARG